VRRKILWSALAVAALAGSGAALRPFVSGGAGLGPGQVSLAEVARGRFVRRVTAEGYLEAVRATPITVPVREAPEGFKILWIARDGSRLKEGDPVLQLDPSALERAYRDSLDDRTSAERKAHKAKVESEAARGNLAADAEVAAREREHAEKFTSQDDAVFSRNEIIESEIDRDLAAKKSDRLTWKIGKTDEQSALGIRIEEIHGEAAASEMKRARQALGSLVVPAPHTGILELDRNRRGEAVKVGDSVWPGQKVAEIPDLGAMQACVYVLEADAGGLLPGRTAHVALAAKPDVAIPATVTRVDAIAKPLKRNVPVQYFETILSLSPPPGLVLKPGERVRASILLDDVASALTVPRQSVFEKDGRRIVYRLESGGLRPVDVKVGRFGLASVLIEDGLKEGDRIALRDPFAAAEAPSPRPSAAPGAKP